MFKGPSIVMALFVSGSGRMPFVVKLSPPLVLLALVTPSFKRFSGHPVSYLALRAQHLRIDYRLP
jgi:hypothetical protein